MGVFVTSKAEGNTTRHRVFEQVYGSWRIITLCPMLLGIMCWLLNRVLLPLLLYPWGGGAGLQRRYRVSYNIDPDRESISNLPNLQDLHIRFYR
jgi:hypothetical protein